MGNDGGSIPDRRDLVRNKPKAEQADRYSQMITRWFFCALSKRPLQEPVVSCPLGKLYNKDAILEFLLDKSAYGDGNEICGHIRSLKDVKTLKFTHNLASMANTADFNRHAQFACPLTLKEMIGTHPFVYLSTCGCVFSQAGLRALSSSATPSNDAYEAKTQQREACPQCTAKFTRSTDVVLLNPGPEDELPMRESMEIRRNVHATLKGKKSKKRKFDGTPPPAPEPLAKRVAMEPSLRLSRTSTPHQEPYTNNATATSRTVADALALEEKRRKSSMSEAVRSLYTSKPELQKKETFMTRATFTRYA